MRLPTALFPYIAVNPPSQDFISNVMVILLWKNSMEQGNFQGFT